MEQKKRFALLTLIPCILIIAALAAVYYVTADHALAAINQKIDVFAEKSGPRLSLELRSMAKDLNVHIDRLKDRLAPVLFGFAGVAALILWLFIQLPGKRRAVGFEGPDTSPSIKAEKGNEKPSPDPAVQLLSILQRQGRLIDFLEEDLSLYEDSQIGAAVRNVHAGCREALKEHVRLSPIFEEEEGSEIIVSDGFDAYEIRLTGNVTGNPPFKGALRHRGWKISEIDLPRRVESGTKWIIAPAEVEV